MRLQRAILFVKDFDQMTEFYRDVLQMKPLPHTAAEGWLEFDSGLALHAIPVEIAQEIHPGPILHETPLKLAFAVDDLEAEYRRLKGLDVPITLYTWGAADGVDPEGNIFQLCRVQLETNQPVHHVIDDSQQDGTDDSG